MRSSYIIDFPLLPFSNNNKITLFLSLYPIYQVFLRESLEHRLEKQREVEVLKAAMIIQAYVTGYMARYKQ